MEDLNWKLVLLRFVWVLGQQPCWSAAMCLQVRYFGTGGVANVLCFRKYVYMKRHQTKGPKNRKNPWFSETSKQVYSWWADCKQITQHMSWVNSSDFKQPICWEPTKKDGGNFRWTQALTGDNLVRKLGTFSTTWCVMVCVFDGHFSG